MKRALIDLETDGFLEVVSKVHVMVVQDLQTGEARIFRQHQMVEGLAYLDTFDQLIGHNVIKYDSQVLTKLFGYQRGWKVWLDTLVYSRVVWPDIVLWDLNRRKNPKVFFPGNLTGKYSLEAWGHRLGNYKGAYNAGWDQWSQEMEDYCVQDVAVTKALLERIEKEHWAAESVDLEMHTAWIVARQERYGFLFDQEAAAKLYAVLVQRRMVLERDLQKVFLPRYMRDGKPMVPKIDNLRYGYSAGAEFQKLKLVQFNPGSRDHIAMWLKAMRGWVPTEFTDDGSPKVDDEVMAHLPYPEAPLLKEYLMVAKRIGQLAEGKEAWLKRIAADGRIHGSVNTGGTVTGRMSHSGPNLGQVVAAYSPYGKEMRTLFIVATGKLLMGCDADALELRDLAGYMAPYDNGAYIEAVVNGDKKLGTDSHSINARALGLDPKAIYFDGETGRDIAKTWFYAFIYGAGDEKLGFILLRKWGPKAVKRGKQARADLLQNLPALAKLVNAVKKKAKAQGWLRGQDGRRIPIRHQHAALNTLLQSAGAVQMKRGLCLLDDRLQELGLTPGIHYEFVANVHDEWQIEVDHDKVEIVGAEAALAIQRAGEYYGFVCPLKGDWKSGANWYETH